MEKLKSSGGSFVSCQNNPLVTTAFRNSIKSPLFQELMIDKTGGTLLFHISNEIIHVIEENSIFWINVLFY